jgi:regulator of protease activity HflC (stomatin/prohibitin superfamily)
MKTILRNILPVLLVSGLLAATGCKPCSTDSTEVGVRVVKWSPFGKKGVQDTIYPPGQTKFLPILITDWYTFDTRLQKLDMSAVIGRGDRIGRDELLFKTIDGNDIALDVTIQYRIIPEKAPHILQEAASTDEALKENVVRTITRSKPRDIFGELRTEDFYVSNMRIAKAEEVKEKLNGILEKYGVIIDRVNLGNYMFNPEYEKAIEDKKVADQEAEKLKSETTATIEEFHTEVEKALAEVEKIKANADGEYTRAVIEADAYYEQQEQLAKAIIAEGKAEAEGIREMNRALSGSGGEAMVKLEIADALNGKRIIMLPMGGGGMDLRTTDINGLLQLYGLKSLSGTAQPAPAEKP